MHIAGWCARLLLQVRAIIKNQATLVNESTQNYVIARVLLILAWIEINCIKATRVLEGAA